MSPLRLAVALLAFALAVQCARAVGPVPDPATAQKLFLVAPAANLGSITLRQAAKYIEKESRKLDHPQKGRRGLIVRVLREKDFRLSIPEPDAHQRMTLQYNTITLRELVKYTGYLFQRKVWILKRTVLFVPFNVELSQLQQKKFVR